MRLPGGRKARYALVSLAVNLGLVVGKGAAAALTGSVAVLADAADSLLDLFSSLLALVGVVLGGRPADETHSYGHGRFETAAALLQVALIALTALGIGVEAVLRLRRGVGAAISPLAPAAVLVGVLVALAMGVFLRHAAREVGGSAALEADALHFLGDLWAKLAAALGLVLASRGVWWADPGGAMMVTMGMVLAAGKRGWRHLGELTDRAPPAEVMGVAAQAISSVPDVVRFHDLRGRTSGGKLFLDVCVEVRPGLSLEDAHLVSEEVERRLKGTLGEAVDVVVHIEPFGHDSPGPSAGGEAG